MKKILLGLDNSLVLHSFCFSSFCYVQDGGLGHSSSYLKVGLNMSHVPNKVKF